MSLTVAQIYSVRFADKLPLPAIIQENIAKLRITPVVFKPFRPPQRVAFKPKSQPDNWRENFLVDAVRRVKEKDDPEYAEVFSCINKISEKTLEKLSKQIIENIQKRDETFRLRVTTLLFDTVMTQGGFYVDLMSHCVKHLATEIPEIKEDILVQTEMFPKLYNMTETITYPSMEQSGYSDRVVEWTNMKNKRRGYAKFITNLFVRELLPEEIVEKSLKQVIEDLNDTVRQTKTEQTEENASQFVVFLYECVKSLPPSATSLREMIRNCVATLLALPRAELPSLNMRSRFKLEDTLKCVQ
jgi:hypothetical protein